MCWSLPCHQHYLLIVISQQIDCDALAGTKKHFMLQIQCKRSLNMSWNDKTQSSMMVFSSQLVTRGKVSSGIPLCCLNTGIQCHLKYHLPSHCCSRSRERFPRKTVSHLTTPHRCPGCLKASWTVLDTYVLAAEPAFSGKPAEWD